MSKNIGSPFTQPTIKTIQYLDHAYSDLSNAGYELYEWYIRPWSECTSERNVSSCSGSNICSKSIRAIAHQLHQIVMGPLPQTT